MDARESARIAVAALIERECNVLAEFQVQAMRVRAVHDEFKRATKGKNFLLGTHDIGWQALVDSRDMLVIRMSGWAISTIEPGGFWGKLQAKSNGLFVPKVKKPEHDDNATEREAVDAEDAYQDRLIGEARRLRTLGRRVPRLRKKPRGKLHHADIKRLREKFIATIRPVIDDRNAHRAHPYQFRPGKVRYLGITGVERKLKYAVGLFNDLLFIANGIQVDLYLEGFQHQAQKLVDAIVFAVADAPSDVFGSEELLRKHTGMYHPARRKKLYQRLHVLHRKSSSQCFNDPELYHQLGEELAGE